MTSSVVGLERASSRDCPGSLSRKRRSQGLHRREATGVAADWSAGRIRRRDQPFDDRQQRHRGGRGEGGVAGREEEVGCSSGASEPLK
jgi:hypothetical protein